MKRLHTNPAAADAEPKFDKYGCEIFDVPGCMHQIVASPLKPAAAATGPKRTCNRHIDCDKADAEAKAALGWLSDVGFTEPDKES